MTTIGDRRIVQALLGGGHAYVLLDDAARVEARYLRRDHGQTYAEVTTLADWAGLKNPISSATLNLSSQTSRNGLAGYCGKRSKSEKTFDWHDTIDSACIAIIEADRQGKAPIVLDDAADVITRDFNVLGLTIPADAASMLIAHGDSMKSLLTLLILGTLAREGRLVLYLDWEWTAARHKARKRRLFGPDRLENLHYLRCNAPLVVECDRIRRYCDEHQIAFIAVDSVGLACDGKLADDDVAIRFHRALATLPPALCSAHVPKSSLGPDGKGDAVGPFGSVFFSNLCRMSWLVKKQPGASDDIVTIGLFAQKQNDGARVRPVGLEFTFHAERIDVQPVDVAAVEGFASRLSISARMTHLLKGAPMTCAEIADKLGEKLDSVVKAAKRDIFTKGPSPDGKTRIALVERRTA